MLQARQERTVTMSNAEQHSQGTRMNTLLPRHRSGGDESRKQAHSMKPRSPPEAEVILAQQRVIEQQQKDIDQLKVALLTHKRTAASLFDELGKTHQLTKAMQTEKQLLKDEIGILSALVIDELPESLTRPVQQSTLLAPPVARFTFDSRQAQEAPQSSTLAHEFSLISNDQKEASCAKAHLELVSGSWVPTEEGPYGSVVDATYNVGGRTTTVSESSGGNVEASETSMPSRKRTSVGRTSQLHNLNHRKKLSTPQHTEDSVGRKKLSTLQHTEDSVAFLPLIEIEKGIKPADASPSSTPRSLCHVRQEHSREGLDKKVDPSIASRSARKRYRGTTPATSDVASSSTISSDSLQRDQPSHPYKTSK